MPPNQKVVYSFPKLKYPTLRDGGLKDSNQWLKGKGLDDGAEGLWRVHDKLYDLEKYIKKHPGGEDWLRLTKNTDITETFESHHMSTIPEKILKQFYVREAKTKRNSPFTFRDDGFYRTLKRRAIPELEKIPKGLAWKSKRILDVLLVSTFTLSIYLFYTKSLVLRSMLAFISGLILSLTVISSHNFIHQKNNWRMYVYNFSFMRVNDMRTFHALSHHMYPNTLLDLEISALEPLFEYMSWKSKHFFAKLPIMLFSTPIMYCGIWATVFLKNVYANIRDTRTFRFQQLIPFTMPLSMYIFGSGDCLETLGWWLLIIATASFTNATISYGAGHHHPDVFHEGDKPKSEETDWGIYQVECMIDRSETRDNFFRGLTHYGDHVLHHLFPTVDHARLQSLYPLVEKTCKEFGTGIRLNTQLECIKGQFRQMVKIQPVKANEEKF